MEMAMATGIDASGEEALMARMASGDNGDPMVALYELYGGRVFGLGVRLLGDRGQAEEMVQETFVRLWRSARRFDPEKGSVRTFTFTIARRVAIDLRRRSAARPNEVAEPRRSGPRRWATRSSSASSSGSMCETHCAR